MVLGDDENTPPRKRFRDGQKKRTVLPQNHRKEISCSPSLPQPPQFQGIARSIPDIGMYNNCMLNVFLVILLVVKVENSRKLGVKVLNTMYCI